MKYAALILACCMNLGLSSQSTHEHGRSILFPNVEGYLSLTSDFHIHSVFSDGSVWPDIRVQEALRDSLDVMAVTEHIEYQPHQDDLPHPDRNRSYELTEKLARPYQQLLIIPGAEITRDMPPGHNNALFIQDANKLLVDDPFEAFLEVKRQGGFVFWNHPNWTAQRDDGIAKLTPMHEQLINQKLLHGIEVVNDLTYSDEALQIALDHNLTILGTSDIHGLIDWQFEVQDGGHRPLTIVFAKEKTALGIKEALFAGRTVAYFKNLLIGKEQHLTPLIRACLTIEKAEYQGASAIAEISIRNHSDAFFMLGNLSEYSFHSDSDIILLPPHSTTKILVKTLKQFRSFDLSFSVLNAISAPATHPNVNYTIRID